MCLWLVSVFRRRTFSSYRLQSSPKVPKGGGKSVFGEKRSRNGFFFQNFATKGFTGTWIHVFLPNFAEIEKAEVTNGVRGIHREKVGISLWFLKRSRQKFYSITLSLFPFPLPRFVKIRSVFEEIRPKMCRRQ